MKWRLLSIAVGCAGLGALAFMAWLLTAPGAIGFAAGRRVVLADYKGPPVTGVPDALRSASLVERGAYLTRAADCEACHTAKGGKPWAGGRAFTLPFGTMYSPNITPDVSTGIGRYSDADFLRAVHDGVAPGGKRLYPAFPYTSYTLLADEDVLAIKAFLFSLKPVRNHVAANTLAFPFNQRWLMAIWSTMFNPDKRFEPIPERGREWNRGAYLVEAAEHCGECHTPRNLMQAVDNRRKFAGAAVDGWRAYDITPDKPGGLGDWSDAGLAQYLANGHSEGHGGAGGPMGEAIDYSLAGLAPDDIGAMVVYLRSVPRAGNHDLPAGLALPPRTPPEEVAADDRAGKRIFESACAGCHAWTGKGALRPAAALTGDRAVNDASGMNVVQTILSGRVESPAASRAMMPAFGAGYSDEEIASVTNYVTGRFGSRSSVRPSDVREARRFTH